MVMDGASSIRVLRGTYFSIVSRKGKLFVHCLLRSRIYKTVFFNIMDFVTSTFVDVVDNFAASGPYGGHTSWCGFLLRIVESPRPDLFV